MNENKRDLGNITVTDKWTTSGGSRGAKQELVDIKIFDENDQDVISCFIINHDDTNYGQGFNVDSIGCK